MKALFIHQNFPGQFKHLAPALQAAGHTVQAIVIDGTGLPGVPMQRYKLLRGSTAGLHPWATEFEARTIRAESARRVMRELKAQGFVPDIVITHPGWGESLCAGEVFPGVRQLHFLEWYFGRIPLPTWPDPELATDPDTWGYDLARNAGNLISMMQMDHGYTPTEWQRRQFPEEFQARVSVVHDGIDTDRLQPQPGTRLNFHRNNLSLGREDELVTFVNRNLEPSRGWHTFARAIPKILARRPKARVVIIGADGASYGPKPKAGSWRSQLWAEIAPQCDVSRVHFLGRVPYATYVNVLQASSCHVYLTIPFFLSWSMLEAMALGCVVLGSDTAPVQEVIRDGENGLLTPFGDVEALAKRVCAVLADPAGHAPLRAAARATIVERYDLKRVCLPQQLALVERVLQG